MAKCCLPPKQHLQTIMAAFKKKILKDMTTEEASISDFGGGSLAMVLEHQKAALQQTPAERQAAFLRAQSSSSTPGPNEVSLAPSAASSMMGHTTAATTAMSGESGLLYPPAGGGSDSLLRQALLEQQFQQVQGLSGLERLGALQGLGGSITLGQIQLQMQREHQARQQFALLQRFGGGVGSGLGLNGFGGANLGLLDSLGGLSTAQRGQLFGQAEGLTHGMLSQQAQASLGQQKFLNAAGAGFVLPQRSRQNGQVGALAALAGMNHEGFNQVPEVIEVGSTRHSTGGTMAGIAGGNQQIVGMSPICDEPTEASSVSVDPAPPLKKGKSSAKASKAESKHHVPDDRPKRPLSAYNLFFRDQRLKLLGLNEDGGMMDKKDQKKLGFAEMAKQISADWKKLDDEKAEQYRSLAVVEKKKYQENMRIFNSKRRKMNKARLAKLAEEDG